MQPTQSSETSAFNTQMPGKYAEDNSSNSKLFHQQNKNHARHLLERKGVLYMEFLAKELTVNSNGYCKTLRSLKQHIRRIRPE
jgi:hypothetical protein